MEAEAAQFRESVVSKFATLLGTSNVTLSRDDADRELLRLIASSVSESDVVCQLPCLDFRSVTDGSLILPKVGEHHHKLQANTLPIDASLLPDSQAGVTPLLDDSGKAEQATAQNLGAPTFWTKSTLAIASTVLERNVSSSFTILVNARIREWTLLLLRQSVNAGDYASRSRLLGLLSATSELKKVSITFRALELPESARGEPTESDVVLPLLFRADLKIGILSHTEDLTLDAPGTISGNFAPSDTGLSLIEVHLNANALLDSMVEKARLVASRAVAQATRVVTDNLSQQPASILHSASQGSLTELTSPRKKVESELVIPTIREEPSVSPRLQKIKSTAMRFSEVLEGKAPSAASGFDVNRSPAMVMLPSAKVELRDTHTLETILMLPPRPRNDLVRRGTASKLKSFQSFGRPHGSDFQSFTGNATFANFGSINEPTWGRDGKLRRHPVPMQGGSIPKYDSFESEGTASSKNAMFPSSPSSSADSVQMLSTHRPGGTRTEPKLSRTATALESWLMDSAKLSS